MKHTKEGQRALKGEIGYREAIGHLYDIKEAFATAQPYSVTVLSYGKTFIYNQGFLCYVHANEIRVLDVHSAKRAEQVLNIRTVLRRVIPNFVPEEEDLVQSSLLYYNDGILAFFCEIGDRGESWLIAVDVTENRRYGRVRVRRQLRSTRRLFVRHNQSFLYYGTHSSLGTHGYHQWAIQCVNLKDGQDLTEKPVVLEGFAGSDIGQTVCFEIYNDHLYAVSNQVNFEEEEVDWTSFYVWACLPPSKDVKCVELNRIWRRQHREGPINDTWTDISLRKDEATERLLILECRREWLDGRSENIRTYYTQPLPLPQEISEGEHQLNATAKQGQLSSSSSIPSTISNSRPPSMMLLPPNEPLTMTLDSSNKPNYAPPKKRLLRHVHAEYSLEEATSHRRDFILAKTKYRTYNPSASAFLDLVNDPKQDSGFSIPRDRLRIRIASRKRRCPIDENGDEGEKGMLFKPELDSDGRPIEWSEERFVSQGIKLWPPEDAPEELTELLCPSKRAGKVQAVADERSLVYSVDIPNMEEQAIILISFDPKIRFPSLKRLSSTAAFQAAEAKAPIGIERPKAGDDSRKRKAVFLDAADSESTGHPTPSFRTEPAMHLSINRGYWLR